MASLHVVILAVSGQERDVQKLAAFCMRANYYKLSLNRRSASIRNSATFIEGITVANLTAESRAA
jgi:hypothetical protein